MRLPSSLIYSVPWNMFLMALGSLIFAFGFKAVAVPYGLLAGGVGGAALLTNASLGVLTPGIWYFLLNVPLFVVGWFGVSRRFVLYSLFGMIFVSFGIDLVSYKVEVENTFLAVMAGGVIMGAGSGIILRSLGSSGGLDIVAVFLNKKYNMKMGQVFFVFNLALFGVGLLILPVNDVLYSLAMLFLTSSTMEYFLSMFNERKMVLVISDHGPELAKAIGSKLGRGATLLHGEGCYTRVKKEVVLTVINNQQLKRLYQIIDDIDPKAFYVVANTMEVQGEAFAKRKTY